MMIFFVQNASSTSLSIYKLFLDIKMNGDYKEREIEKMNNFDTKFDQHPEFNSI